MHVWLWLVAGLVAPWISGCGDDTSAEVPGPLSVPNPDGCEPDETGAVPDRENHGVWNKVELDGTVCSNGTPYKFFVNYSATSNNLAVIFEPGGACWDFKSCSGGGLRGAANPEGIPDTHMNIWAHAHPFAGGMFGEDGALADWNKVFISYCTGDVHSGSRVVTYTSEAGEEMTYRHVGHDNMLVVANWLNETFETVPRLFMTGCSAGGIGALLNYHLVRSRVEGAQCGYLLNDSGPLFPTDGPSRALHERVRESFNSEVLIDFHGEALGESAAEVIRDDFGALNTELAKHYPKDRLSLVLYQRDLNYSLYSYDTFFDFPPYDTIRAHWDTDLDALLSEYDEHDNLAYYVPFFREDNCSHCVSILPVDSVSEVASGALSPFAGTDIEDVGMTFPGFVDQLLDDGIVLNSFYEEARTDGDFREEQIAECRE